LDARSEEALDGVRFVGNALGSGCTVRENDFTTAPLVYETYSAYAQVMSEMAVTDAREHLSDVVNRAAYGGETVYLTRRGRRVAAIVPAELLEALEAAEDAADVAAAREAMAEDGAVISLEEFRADLAQELTGQQG
jgi:prevent-host-death family protein